ncbi:hypothetical protein FisN_23Hu263 [Fistulifera solaris]|uniref:FAD-binding FR-type domain-containing protein n=1 Tax=Fistulifera solaris TaxID=1519565 RepID=A0A1Z5JWT5_FISSO|nr:hypothetical protein FisN_23Hu263 [Fistulifera solaris]|eukprot:GAX18369.1 hypothetical protein FisN_23Hu263 [Fistulifera solaris]
MDYEVEDWSSILVGLVAPAVLTSCICALLLTNHPLPTWRCGWFNKIAAGLRRHPSTKEGDAAIDASLASRLMSSFKFFLSSLRLPFQKMVSDAEYGHDLASKKINQFGRGEANFNAMSIWLVFLPMVISIVATLPDTIERADERAAEDGSSATAKRLERISYLFGWVSALCLSLFLIPITKHSVLLAAMGWSPIHALRIHIWFGYLAFVYMFIHGILLIPVWFIYEPYPVYKQIIPNPGCWDWTWTKENRNDILPQCRHVHANLSGVVAAVFFVVLWGSSLNWVRRANYRLFYISHITFGTLALLGTILHMYWFVIYFIPSITYYLASNTPTLVQAFASRFRGGVKIRKVVLVENSGGCVEVQMEAHRTAHAVLDREPCQFIKLCVPTISLIWHPFDVFKSYSVDGMPDDTVRFLFRPVGPFTKELARRLTSDVVRPVTLVDGFYLGADKSELAMQHDCVTLVAGGVALSPYLTLIPALLNRIASAEISGDSVKTKSIVLHWVVREPGLCRHYVQNYINSILKRARVLNLDTTLAVYVYLTGGDKNLGDPSEMTAAAELSKSTVETPFADQSANLSPDDTADAGSGSSDEGKSTRDYTVVVQKNSTGHPLELARMLPRRYSAAVWNIPFFVFYSGVTFFGFWYLFSQTPDKARSYYELSKMTWIVVDAVLMYFGFGILSEAFVLGLRKYWPQPKLDDFEIVAANGKMKELSDSDNGDVINVEDGNLPSANVTIVYRQGRPDADQVFEDARMAAEPGIFMCGPSALTHMVKAEASKENSYLGLTRYCLYDEPYEM